MGSRLSRLCSPPVRIIVNADDFGYSPDTVEATIQCFQGGLLTSATIMANATATEPALEFARSRDDLSFGVHLTWTGDGQERCVAAPASVPSLVDGDGRLRPTRQLRGRALMRQLPVAEIAREADAQIARVAGAGISVSHVDSHRHLHKLAPFHTSLQRVLPRFAIRRVRTAQDLFLARPPLNATYWFGRLWQRRIERDFVTSNHFYMPTTAGDREWHRIADSLPSSSPATIEIGLHPGQKEDWRRLERDGLPRFIDAVLKTGHELVSWQALPG